MFYSPSFMRQFVFSLAGFIFAVPVLAAARPDILQEYKRFYEEINIKWDAKDPNVVELFSYNCNQCQDAEKTLDYFKKNKPKTVRFEQYAVTTSNMNWKLSQYAFRAAYLAGVEKEVRADLFNKMNIEKKLFNTKADVSDYFKKKGMGAKVEPLLESQASKDLRDRIYDMAIAAKVRRTPTILVNGKYRVAWGSDQQPEKLAALLTALAEKSNPQTACPRQACSALPAPSNM